MAPAMLIDAAPEEALYAALPLDIEEGAKERKWMLLALRRSNYLALRYAQEDQEIMGALYLDVRNRLIERPVGN